MSKPIFLKLHDADTNGVVIINANSIVLFAAMQNEADKYTEITVESPDDDVTITVNETPEKINQTLADEAAARNENARYILLHDADTNGVIGVRYADISYVGAPKGAGTGTEVYLNNDVIDMITVNESAEKIYNNLVNFK